MLDDRHRQAEHIQFLEGVGAQQRRADLAGDGDHRYRIQHRIGNAGTRFEAPGPEVATQTPTWLLARAKLLAASAAPC
ncbi:hypothetical protein [Stenotrophomonas sp. S11A1a]|uniref:hypothetical protein n=1 Tax=Stenotrophomonas sp. S11A1a TaxID=3455011 RepID=UPI003F7ACDF2